MYDKYEKMMRKWADSWHGMPEDIPYGEKIVAGMRPFVKFLVDSCLTDKTVGRHVDNLWVLGGEIIRDVSMEDDYDSDPLEKLKESVDDEGGIFCHHLYSDAERNSYDATCRKLHEFLKDVCNSGTF